MLAQLALYWLSYFPSLSDLICVCMYVWSEVEVSSSICLYLIFWHRVSSWTCSSLIWLYLLASKLQWSCCLHILSLGILQVFIKWSSECFQGKHFINWLIMVGEEVWEAPLAVNGYWKRRNHFLQWCSHWLVAHAPVNNVLPMLIQAAQIKHSGSHT